MFRVLQSSIRDAEIHETVTIVEPANIYECKIDQDSFVGPFVEIQKEAKVGKRVRIQSHSFICDKVTIGDDVFIGHGVVFVNDKFAGGNRANGDPKKIKTTFVDNGVLIGSNSTILPVRICTGAVIGAGSVVVKNISKPGIYAGNPARLIKEI